MQVEVLMPKMGESITEGKIVKWHKKPGEKIERDEILLEISTDKVDTEIPAVASGILAKISVKEQEIAQVGSVIGYIETDLADFNNIEAESTRRVAGAELELADSTQAREIRSEGSQQESNRFLSPLVRSMAKAEGVSAEELDAIGGSGSGGRITKEDIRNYLEKRGREVGGSNRLRQAGVSSTVGGSRLSPVINASSGKHDESIPMDNMRQRIMEHMVESRDTSVHVAAITEVDLSNIDAFISKHGETFQKQEGFKLTFMPFIAHACVKALKEFPLLNSSIEGTKIIQHNYINLGIAVAIESKGLLVPVIKGADEKSVLGLARAIRDLATRARSKRLTVDDTVGSTFSVTNYGVFGNLIGTPIINQPNVAILGVGVVKKRPVVINDAIAIRQVGFLTLSFDHRLIDGAVGGQFLERIVHYLENAELKQVF